MFRLMKFVRLPNKSRSRLAAFFLLLALLSQAEDLSAFKHVCAQNRMQSGKRFFLDDIGKQVDYFGKKRAGNH